MPGAEACDIGRVWIAPTRVHRVMRRWPERLIGAHGVQSAHTRRATVVGGCVLRNADTMPNTRLPGSARPAVESSAESAGKVWAQKFGLELGVLRARSHPALPGVANHVLRVGHSTTPSACQSGSAQTATTKRHLTVNRRAATPTQSVAQRSARALPRAGGSATERDAANQLSFKDNHKTASRAALSAQRRAVARAALRPAQRQPPPH